MKSPCKPSNWQPIRTLQILVMLSPGRRHISTSPRSRAKKCRPCSNVAVSTGSHPRRVPGLARQPPTSLTPLTSLPGPTANGRPSPLIRPKPAPAARSATSPPTPWRPAGGENTSSAFPCPGQQSQYRTTSLPLSLEAPRSAKERSALARVSLTPSSRHSCHADWREASRLQLPPPGQSRPFDLAPGDTTMRTLFRDASGRSVFQYQCNTLVCPSWGSHAWCHAPNDLQPHQA